MSTYRYQPGDRPLDGFTILGEYAVPFQHERTGGLVDPG